MAPVFGVIPRIFEAFGFECYLTSCVRPKDRHSFHGYGLAADFDASVEITADIGQALAKRAEFVLGTDYTCLWHKEFGGGWHLHVEFDIGREGLERFLARGGLEVTPPPASSPSPGSPGRAV
jgi:hypothetical protein